MFNQTGNDNIYTMTYTPNHTNYGSYLVIQLCIINAANVS